MDDPSLHGLASRLGDLELDRSSSLLLHHHGAGCHRTTMGDIGYLELYEIAGA